MSVYLFPGQGSQVKGMGEGLFEEFPELTSIANDILGYSIQDLCLNDSKQELNQTQYTQPALYVVNALSYFKKLLGVEEKPCFVAGHSLGEYNALLAAEVFDFATGLKLVQKRGELMSQATNGAMAAILGLPADKIKQTLQEADLPNIAIANYNSYLQTVISGLQEEILFAQKIFEEVGASLVIPLKTSGAFHSPYMQAASEQYSTFVCQFDFAEPKIPVIANLNAKPYIAKNIHENLVRQITSPVYWVQTIEYLIAQNEIDFEEIGCGKVLSGLLKRIKKGS